MLQVRHYNPETGHTEDVGQPMPNRNQRQAEEQARALNTATVNHEDLYYVGATRHRTKHDFQVV